MPAFSSYRLYGGRRAVGGSGGQERGWSNLGSGIMESSNGRSTKTILIVDDEEDLRQSVAEALESNGYHVVLSADGREGIDDAIAHVPDLILVDYRMPEADGVQFLRDLRSHDAVKDTPVMIVTVDPQLELRKSATDLGIQGFLVKPFSMSELVQCVRNLLQTN
jgi:DNA-binding response OmpR family regulator